MDNTSPIVSCRNLVKIYKILDLEVNRGEILALVGPSGAGKSTLLNVLGGLVIPSAGEILVNKQNLLTMQPQERILYKRSVVGFVWQQPSRNLINYLSARENIEMPMMLNKVPRKLRKSRAMELLDMVGLADQAELRPEQLSGGQQQRVSIAVALANHPPILLGDELTGQIDSSSTAQVFAALRRINQNLSTTILLVTHDPKVSGLVNRVVAIRDGRTSTEIIRQNSAGETQQHEEWVILDKTGRMQIPEPFVDKLFLRDRVKVRLEEDYLSVWPSKEKISDTNEQKQRSFTTILNNLDKNSIQTSGARIQVVNLWRTYKTKAREVHAVSGLNMDIPSGKLTVIKGRSGSGKTTFLNLISGLDQPSQGKVFFDGVDLKTFKPRQLVDLRRRRIGFIYQTFGLMPFLSVKENIEIPLRLVKAPHKLSRARIQTMLELVGLEKRANHRIYELSGGEQQRASIARALVNYPQLILADEPTGQLDAATGADIIMLLKHVVSQLNITVIIASHDPNIHAAADVIYELWDGRLFASNLNVQRKTKPIERQHQPTIGP